MRSGQSWDVRSLRPVERRRTPSVEGVSREALPRAFGVLRGEDRLARGSSQAIFGPQKGTLMSAHTFNTRGRSSAMLSALDFGLRVRVEAPLDQLTIFSGAENLSAQGLTSELSEMVG